MGVEIVGSQIQEVFSDVKIRCDYPISASHGTITFKWMDVQESEYIPMCWTDLQARSISHHSSYPCRLDVMGLGYIRVVLENIQYGGKVICSYAADGDKALESEPAQLQISRKYYYVNSSILLCSSRYLFREYWRSPLLWTKASNFLTDFVNRFGDNLLTARSFIFARKCE